MATCLFPGLALGEVSCIGHRRLPRVDFATRVTLRRRELAGDVAMDYLSPRSIRRLALRGLRGGLDIDFLTGTEMRWQDGHEVNREWTIDRNSMFLELMRDFMDLAGGREPQGNPLLPRLDLVMESSALIARAWEARQFHGEINWSKK